MYNSDQAYYLSFHVEFSFQANLCPDPCFKAGAADSLDSTSKIWIWFWLKFLWAGVKNQTFIVIIFFFPK